MSRWYAERHHWTVDFEKNSILKGCQQTTFAPHQRQRSPIVDPQIQHLAVFSIPISLAPPAITQCNDLGAGGPDR